MTWFLIFLKIQTNISLWSSYKGNHSDWSSYYLLLASYSICFISFLSISIFYSNRNKALTNALVPFKKNEHHFISKHLMPTFIFFEKNENITHGDNAMMRYLNQKNERRHGIVKSNNRRSTNIKHVTNTLYKKPPIFFSLKLTMNVFQRW